MESNGGFHEVEKDGKLVLVYHHPKYCPIPQTQSPTSSDDLSLQPLFVCPNMRWDDLSYLLHPTTFTLNSSPEYVFPKTTDHDDNYYHYVVPLFWCNNEKFDANGGCDICQGSNFSTDYYFCNYCDEKFHRECVQSPLKIKHPYHSDHILQLSFHPCEARDVECLCCGRKAKSLVYHCTICQAYMHSVCAMKSIPFVLDPPKNHVHPLTFFPRQTSLTCNVCGLLRKNYPTYVCFRCNFVAHNDCMNHPHIIKISRHNHRISFTLSLPSKTWWSCGVCRQSINIDYGAYTCDKCSAYVVHPICATGKGVWDGKELEGVPEEDDITQDAMPFEMISEGVILYFLHDHHLRLMVNIFYEENNFCQACVLPIYEGNFYSCMECEFILHEKCAKTPRIIQHALHPHPLKLEDSSEYKFGHFTCNACGYECGGFVYECRIEECSFYLDVRCASISEPFDYNSHEDPLFLALEQEVKVICHVCETECRRQLNCIKCDFIVCFKCVTLPYKARYKYDSHFLTLSYREVCEKDWCEVCECNLKDTNTKVFYWCKECYTIFHIQCLIGVNPYMKPGQNFYRRGRKVQTLRNCNLSRPLCDTCKNHCQGKIFKRDNNIACSVECIFSYV
ncbi:hypothetical protein CARUB_v10022832mg [Capsella rubella]|uniref:Zinc finger PHD-type domain-containing protein n=1 Tax=Capsella rubella TaxID=81985 RepID=R0FVW8_9BRAS|nr:uncharacterized protein LOC17889319 [Capsella rubella]EOA26746.1 hypothetical protein CARUB_v10022832mg [Capsella rubella]